MTRPTFLELLKNFLLGTSGSTAEEPAGTSHSLPPASPSPLPTPPADTSGPAVPASARKRVATINRMLEDLQQRAAAKGGLGQERIELEQIQTLHVPRLLKSYVEIPPQHRAEIFRTTGRSASFMLTERLDRIIERLTEISRLLAQGDLDAFASNIRFIDTRYGSPGASNEWN